MAGIKTVGIKVLKDNLSLYLREVKAGNLILITDRGVVVAELKKPEPEHLTHELHPLYRAWLEQGWLIPAAKKKKKCVASPIKLPRGSAKSLLDQDRGE